MARLLLLITLLFAIYYFWQKYKELPPKQRRPFLLKTGFWVLLSLLVFAAATGRLHWIGAAIAGAIPVLKWLFGMALRVLPFLNFRRQQKAQDSAQPNATASAAMTEAEAWQVLGLQPGAADEEITKAHKKLIQKLHPDRGGNDYLAARINQAKDLLLKRSA